MRSIYSIEKEITEDGERAKKEAKEIIKNRGGKSICEDCANTKRCLCAFDKDSYKVISCDSKKSHKLKKIEKLKISKEGRQLMAELKREHRKQIEIEKITAKSFLRTIDNYKTYSLKKCEGCNFKGYEGHGAGGDKIGFRLEPVCLIHKLFAKDCKCFVECVE